MQMALGQALFDAVLASQQPVHGGVQLILVDGSQRQQVTEGGDGAFGVEAAGGGEFGACVDDTSDDHGDDEIALAGGGTSDEGMEPEFVERTEDGGDVAVGVAAQATKGGLGIDEGLAFEGSADEIDDVVWEVGDVAESFVADLAILAEGSAEEMGAVGLVFVAAAGGGYVDRAVSGGHREHDNLFWDACQPLPYTLVATHCALRPPPKGLNYLSNKELSALRPSGTSD